MEAQSWRGISVKWTRPHVSDLAVAATLYYLLYLQPEVPGLVAVAVAIASLRCIQLGRAV
ncbi:hypothetical protein [Streptomyces sp. ZSW22]|uniref:hypothetical protein n=1 Tax=Streptomyces sp. ZSW22 TaxID=3055050 RepID=UPI0025B03B31|nr:hypothetical protein [Streptomyces sp. ZSW22]MDN3249734.1 hypothetical protein [Streptomyces sp. ZSW22]